MQGEKIDPRGGKGISTWRGQIIVYIAMIRFSTYLCIKSPAGERVTGALLKSRGSFNSICATDCFSCLVCDYRADSGGKMIVIVSPFWVDWAGGNPHMSPAMFHCVERRSHKRSTTSPVTVLMRVCSHSRNIDIARGIMEPRLIINWSLT